MELRTQKRAFILSGVLSGPPGTVRGLSEQIGKRSRKRLLNIFLLFFCILCISNCTAYKLASGDFAEIQRKIDILEEKAIDKQEFTEQDLSFLKDVYSSLVFGGRLLGYREAADMLERYLSASGEALKIAEDIYVTNEKVKSAMQKIAASMAGDLKTKNLRDKYVSEQIVIEHKENPRLFYFSNVFVLQAQPLKIDKNPCIIRWRVELRAHFPSYAEQKRRYGSYSYFRTPFITNSSGRTFSIDDGLSHYLTVLGLAKEFVYYAEWITAM